MKTALYWQSAAARQALKNSLEASHVSLVSTDTVLGLLAPITQHGFEELNRIKGRFEKPYLILISDHSKIPLFAQPEGLLVKKLINSCWPGPLTLILPAKEGLPPFITSVQKTVALRMPAHNELRAMAQHFDGLFSTSANLAGAPLPEKLADVSPAIVAAVDLVVIDDEKEESDISSTILDCTGEVPKMVREGAYEVAEIEQIIGMKLS